MEDEQEDTSSNPSATEDVKPKNEVLVAEVVNGAGAPETVSDGLEGSAIEESDGEGEEQPSAASRLEPVEKIHAETPTKTEYKQYDEFGKPIHTSKVFYKNESRIEIYPYSYTLDRGLRIPKIKKIEFLGWVTIEEIPRALRTANYKIKLKQGASKWIINMLERRFPDAETLSFSLNESKSRFLKKSIHFAWNDYNNLLKAVRKEMNSFDERSKAAITDQFASLTNKITSQPLEMKQGALTHFLSLYTEDLTLSEGDIDALMGIISSTPAQRISITSNYIRSKDKINVAYLEDIIARFEKLMASKVKNEKEWQEFFSKHGWMLASLFPFPVVLYQKEAYIGGKTIQNQDGRVVDFLFQNGFEDNYALLEIKTHLSPLMSNTAYRSPDVYSAHSDLSGAINQCLDQKQVFMNEMGARHRALDPKCVLVIGNRSDLSESQATCFELMRANQKNVEIFTFDELAIKINGLRDILQS